MVRKSESPRNDPENGPAETRHILQLKVSASVNEIFEEAGRRCDPRVARKAYVDAALARLAKRLEERMARGLSVDQAFLEELGRELEPGGGKAA